MKSYLALGFLSFALLVSGCTGAKNNATPDPETVTSAKLNAAGAASAVTVAATTKESAAARVINHVPLKERKIALTFDDGPDNKYTPKILDILKKYNIQATFFVVGEHAEKYPEVIKRIAQEGHVIGNHTWDHQDLVHLPNDQIQDEIKKTDDMIKSITGQPPALFRAPYGAVSQDVKEDAALSGHRIIGWSVDTLDWDGKSVNQIMAAVKKEAAPGAIVLQHSAGGKNGNLSNTLEALPQIITYLQKSGYSFVTVPDLLTSLDSR
ncbi:polysaccharide deacetylase family protein [Paenibacillus sp. GCM10027628]|uniref:polysaccharide deacetylase family protein n=1 Tax=Paenibacillus sp. GCM10027628 TaxID=3273413 RepID=UPI00363877C2